MRKLGDKLLVAAYVTLALLPLVAMLLGLQGKDVFGALPPKPRPTLTWKAALTERFQHGFAAWFERTLGLKGTSIAIDNGVLYRVFRETKPGSPVVIGEDRVLFLDEDIAYLNKRGASLPTPEYIEKLVSQIAEVQRRLQAQGKAFVPVIVAAKTSLWRDKVPARWRHEHADAPLSDVYVYQAFKNALDRHGVYYTDGRQLLTTSTAPRELLFGPDARHWSDYGGCLAMRDVARVYEQLTRRTLEYQCDLKIVHGRRFVHADYDLWRLLNAYGVRTGTGRVALADHRPPTSPAERPSVLFVATSFGWQLVIDAYRTGRFGRIDMNYYDQTFVTYPEYTSSKVEPGTDAWRGVVMGKDLYVLDLLETYLGAPGSYVELFLGELLAELDHIDASSAPR